MAQDLLVYAQARLVHAGGNALGFLGGPVAGYLRGGYLACFFVGGALLLLFLLIQILRGRFVIGSGSGLGSSDWECWF